VQERSFFLFSAIPTSVDFGRSKPMRVGLLTGIIRLRALMNGILFQDEGNVLNVREIASANSELTFEASFGFKPFVYLKHEPNL
jgi:hypothetical protein